MTDSTQEMVDLCKEVYEKTGWIVGDESWDWYTTTNPKLDSMFIAPKYYTDYLLERLPDVSVGQFNDEWLAESGRDSKGSDYGETGDTPLKALLKLTIKLEKILEQYSEDEQRNKLKED